MKRFCSVMLMVIIGMCAADARVIKGVAIPDSVMAGGTKLVLNGAGMRTKLAMDIYIGALYLKAKDANAARIVNADEAMAVRLHIVSGLVTPERMAENTREGFNKSTGGNMGPYKAGMDRFINTFKDGITVGDYYDIMYQPGKGVQVFKNGVPKSSVEGLAFKKALFGIWIGGNPIHEGLKNGMLGK